MANVEVLNWEKKKVGQVDLDESVFAAPVRKDILHSVVRWQLAARRQGTHKTKTRGEVRGGGKKPFRQKGTGNARQGTSRSPLMPGGAILFGPRPRKYDHDLPKKVRALGLRSALAHLFSQGKLVVVEDMKSEAGKTKELAQRLQKFGLEKAVLVDREVNDLFKRATSNMPKFKYYSVDGLNVYDLLKFDQVIVTKESLDRISQRCGVRS